MQRLPYSVCKPVYDVLGIEMHPEQLAIVKSQDRFPVICGGERGSKTVTSVIIALPHVVMMPEVVRKKFYDENGNQKFNPNTDKPRSPHVILFGPTYAEPREEFQWLERWLDELGLLADGLNKPSKPQEGQWRMTTKQGVVIVTWSLEDPTSVRSVDPEFVIMCEAGKCPYDGVERANGRVSGTQGFIIYSGTMEEANQWYIDWLLMGKRENELGLVSYSLPSWTNRHVFGPGIDPKTNQPHKGGLDHPEMKRLRTLYTDDVWAMRVAAEPRPPRTRVLKEFTDKSIKRLKSIPADAWWDIMVDPGYASAYGNLFVAHWLLSDEDAEKRGYRRQFYVRGELYLQGLPTTDVIAACKRTPYWDSVTNGVIDIAAKGRRDAGEPALAIWQRKTRIPWNMKYWREETLIERLRSCAKLGQVIIDPDCKGLIAELGLGEPVFPEMHAWKYPVDASGHILGEKPIDKWNHSAKALGYGLLHWLGPVETLRKTRAQSRMKPGVSIPTKGSYARRMNNKYLTGEYGVTAR